MANRWRSVTNIRLKKIPCKERMKTKKKERGILSQDYINPDLCKCLPLLLEQLCNDSSFQHVQVLRLDPVQDQDDGGAPI